MTVATVSEAQSSGARLNKVCAMLGISARTIERWRQNPNAQDGRHGPQRSPGNALSVREQARIVALMTTAEHRLVSPRQLVPQLADQGIYLASESTMYRLQRRFELRAPTLRGMRTHVTRATTVHCATAANQVWSWDITYLPTLVRGKFLRLYLVLDVWSRRIVGWRVHDCETAELAAEMIKETCSDANIDPRGLVLHSDNGHPMRGNTMVSTLQWLGIVPSFSRPHVSDDNPYSEALFRTLKHGPTYPRLPFASIESARAWVARFVGWYNSEHRHSAIRFVTPDDRHFGRDANILSRRAELYAKARRKRPERWSRTTRNWTPIGSVILNPKPITADAA